MLFNKLFLRAICRRVAGGPDCPAALAWLIHQKQNRSAECGLVTEERLGAPSWTGKEVCTAALLTSRTVFRNSSALSFRGRVVEQARQTKYVLPKLMTIASARWNFIPTRHLADTLINRGFKTLLGHLNSVKIIRGENGRPSHGSHCMSNLHRRLRTRNALRAHNAASPSPGEKEPRY